MRYDIHKRYRNVYVIAKATFSFKLVRKTEKGLLILQLLILNPGCGDVNFLIFHLPISNIRSLVALLVSLYKCFSASFVETYKLKDG